MPNYFTLTLDTTGPSNPTIEIESGATYATSQLVTATIGTSDSSKVGYQMKIWGDVDTAFDTNTTASEGTAVWVTYSATKQIKLLGGDGTKTVYARIRDDVHNESAQASDTIVLNTTLPVVTITGPDVTKVSKITGKNIASFGFSADVSFVEYKVKYVASVGATHDTGVLIGTANSSTNMGETGTWTNASVINSAINGADLELANTGDGAKIVKVFVKNAAGLWSV